MSSQYQPISHPIRHAVTSASAAPPLELATLRNRALAVGLAGVVACAAGAALDPQQFFRSYLVGWVPWLSVGLGCLGLMMLHHLSGGAWGQMLRRPMEAGARTLPLLLVLSLPLFAGMRSIFVWADPERVHGDHMLEHKAAYLNVPFFTARTVLILALFAVLGYALSRKSMALETGEEPRCVLQSMHTTSAVGFLAFIVLASFLGFDWLMSLDPYWFSSLYGGIFVAGSALSGLAFLILIANWLRQRAPLDERFTRKHFHDFGKLLFAFVMFFTYLSISQFIIMWQGNMPEEIVWYQHRFHGGWEIVAIALLVFHFFFPFLILLSRDVKERGGSLAKVAAFVLFMRFVDFSWQIAPSFRPDGFGFHWLDLAAPIAVGGLFVAWFARELAQRAVLPIGDPRLAEALAHD